MRSLTTNPFPLRKGKVKDIHVDASKRGYYFTEDMRAFVGKTYYFSYYTEGVYKRCDSNGLLFSPYYGYNEEWIEWEDSIMSEEYM